MLPEREAPPDELAPKSKTPVDVRTKTAAKELIPEPNSFAKETIAMEAKKPSSTPSIKDALSALKKPAAIPFENTSAADEIDTVNDTNEIEKEVGFSREELHKFWNEFIVELKSSQPRMHNALRNQELALSDDQTIQVFFRNNAQIEDFKLNIKPSLLSSLRSSIQSPSLEIIEMLKDPEDAPQTKHYSDSDKLKHMIEKNPILQKLYQEFNLDFE